MCGVLLCSGAPRHVGLKYKTEKEMYEELKFTKTRVESVKRRDSHMLCLVKPCCWPVPFSVALCLQECCVAGTA